jgi:cytochrome c5
MFFYSPSTLATTTMSAISRPLTVFAALAFGACASSGGQPEPAPAPQPAAAPAPASTAPSPAAGAAPSGLFSQAQANRGRDTFRSMCTECHTAAEFTDNAFKVKWARRTVGDLYQFIHTSMPDDAPGVLTEAQALELTSYILEMNGFTAGSRQMQPAGLDQISLAPIRG